MFGCNDCNFSHGIKNLSPSFTRFPENVRAQLGKSDLSTDVNVEYYENMMFIVTAFALTGNKEIATNL